MNTPRLFDVDRTPAERRATRRTMRAAQLDMFAADLDDAPPACPVCAGSHPGECPHGTADALPLDDAPTFHYATAAECGDDIAGMSGAYVTRTYILTGSTRCPHCPGDLTDEHHWREVDIAGKPVAWESPDMFTAAYIASLGPRRTYPNPNH